MKRLLVLALLAVLCLPLASFASSIGGAETQGQGEFAVGLDQEFVFDRDLILDKLNRAVNPGENLTAEIDNMYRTMLKTSYGVLDNLDIYIKLGTADFKMKDVDSNPGAGEEWHTTTKGKNAFVYGFGVKFACALEDNWIIGADSQYLRHRNKFGTSSFDALSPGDSGSGPGKATFQEWHVAPYIAKKIGSFVPYLGVKYSDLRIKQKYSDGDMVKWKADDNVGVFIGTDYKIGEQWKLNLEGRFVDETAMSFAAAYKF